MAELSDWEPINKGDKTLWAIAYGDDGVLEGERYFTFDKKQIFNLFRDYPQALTPEQKAVFDRENPYWKKFFEQR